MVKSGKPLYKKNVWYFQYQRTDYDTYRITEVLKVETDIITSIEVSPIDIDRYNKATIVLL
jgi:hypothetical protein